MQNSQKLTLITTRTLNYCTLEKKTLNFHNFEKSGEKSQLFYGIY